MNTIILTNVNEVLCDSKDFRLIITSTVKYKLCIFQTECFINTHHFLLIEVIDNISYSKPINTVTH